MSLAGCRDSVVGVKNNRGTLVTSTQSGHPHTLVFQRPLRPTVLPRASWCSISRTHLVETALCTDAAMGEPIDRADTIVRGPLEQGPGPMVWVQGVEAMQQEPEGSSPMLVREVPPSWRDWI